MLEHSNPVIILLFLMCFACATISKAFMVTTWFSRANIAACAGGIVFFTLYLPYPFVKLWTHRFNIHTKGAVSLISNVAFGLGTFAQTGSVRYSIDSTATRAKQID